MEVSASFLFLAPLENNVHVRSGFMLNFAEKLILNSSASAIF